MLKKSNAFNTFGEFITFKGKEISKETGIAWFSEDIKSAVDELILEIDETFPNSEGIRKMIIKHFKVLGVKNARH
jgi:alpha-L-arabinofuranosidase